jgi:very-short-patch-repair endonuclease
MRSLAARQHGVVARAQLLEAGVPAHAIDHRLARRRIDLVHRGVYRVGPAALPHERELAAVLAYGSSAVLSHRSAALLHGLVAASSCDATVDVIVAGGHRTPLPGLRVHEVSCLPADEVTIVDGIPVTVPARTLLDLAGQGDLRALEQAMAQAERAGLAPRADLARLATRHQHRRGMAAIRRLLAAGTEPAFTRSEAEIRFLALVRKAQLPTPATNAALCGYEVDFLWRAEGLVVEIDGFAFHASSAAFERDRRRDGVLAASGFRVLRVTWRQISGEPEALLVRLAQALVQRRG